jgi:hypothetical protein
LCGGIGHVGPEEKEVVAVVLDDGILVTRPWHVFMELAADHGAAVPRRWPEEELGEVEVVVVDEEAGKRGREEIQQTENVDGGLPGLADAARRREVVRP